MKTGWKTSEFWLAMSSLVVTFLISAGVFADDSFAGKLLGLAAAALTSLGYSVSRALTKGAESKAEAVKALASAPSSALDPH